MEIDKIYLEGNENAEKPNGVRLGNIIIFLGNLDQLNKHMVSKDEEKYELIWGERDLENIIPLIPLPNENGSPRAFSPIELFYYSEAVINYVRERKGDGLVEAGIGIFSSDLRETDRYISLSGRLIKKVKTDN